MYMSARKASTLYTYWAPCSVRHVGHVVLSHDFPWRDSRGTSVSQLRFKLFGKFMIRDWARAIYLRNVALVDSRFRSKDSFMHNALHLLSPCSSAGGSVPRRVRSRSFVWPDFTSLGVSG